MNVIPVQPSRPLLRPDCAPRGRGGDEVYAALDLGTNNCRMLVARPVGRGFRVIDAFSRATRLGEGLAKSGALSDPAMDRTVEALKVCADKMVRRGVTRARNVATEACRRACNGEAFLARVAAETGVTIETIDPHEEARLALAGCAPLLDRRLPHALVFDIGGGSTELVWTRMNRGTPEPVAVASVPLGVVTLAERNHDRLASAKGYAELVEEVIALLRPFDEQCQLRGPLATGRMQMLGTSGTVTTLAGIHLDLPRYDRSAVDGLTMEFIDIETVSRRLGDMDNAARAAHPCIGRERADLVLAGCAILEGICHLWPLGRLTVADRGVREGVLLGMMRADQSQAAE